MRDVSLDKEVSVEFWKSSVSIIQVWTPDSDRIRLGRGLRSASAVVIVYLLRNV